MEELPRLFARKRDATPTAVSMDLASLDDNQQEEDEGDSCLGFYEDVQGLERIESTFSHAGGSSLFEQVYGRPMPKLVLPSDGETVDPEIVLSKQEMRFYRRSKDLIEQMEDLGEAATAGELQEHYDNMKKLQAHFAQRCLRSQGDPSYTNTRMKSLNADAALAMFSYKRSIGM